MSRISDLPEQPRCQRGMSLKLELNAYQKCWNSDMDTVFFGTSGGDIPKVTPELSTTQAVPPWNGLVPKIDVVVRHDPGEQDGERERMQASGPQKQMARQMSESKGLDIAFVRVFISPNTTGGAKLSADTYFAQHRPGYEAPSQQG